jgi:hypothetical protein
MDDAGVPLGLLFLVIIAAPVAIAMFFGSHAMDHVPPMLFRCQQCGSHFKGAAHRGFPKTCSSCHAVDWNKLA